MLAQSLSHSPLNRDEYVLCVPNTDSYIRRRWVTLIDDRQRDTFDWLFFFCLFVRCYCLLPYFHNTRFLLTSIKFLHSAAVVPLLLMPLLLLFVLAMVWFFFSFLFIFFFSIYRVVVNHKRKSVRDAVGHKACEMLKIWRLKFMALSRWVRAFCTRVRCFQFLCSIYFYFQAREDTGSFHFFKFLLWSHYFPRACNINLRIIYDFRCTCIISNAIYSWLINTRFELK